MAGRFGSVVTAMVTPFREDHAVDLDQAQANYDSAVAAVNQAKAMLSSSETDLRNSKIIAPIRTNLIAGTPANIDVGAADGLSFRT